MNILIIGASGFIGQHLLRACLVHEHTVTACVRNGAQLQQKFPAIKLINCDFAKDRNIDTWLPRLTNIDVVINTVGIFQQRGSNTFDALHTKTPRELFKACELKGVRKVIQISALGADDTAFSQYHLSKKAADEYLSSLDLDWTILMPSIVYGPGAKSLRLFKAMAALPVTPVVGNGRQQIQPVFIDDLTKAVLLLVENPSINRQRIEVVGPEPVTLRQLLTLLKCWFGFKRTGFLKIPLGLFLLSARIAEYFAPSPVNVDALKMLQHGNTGNVQQFVKAFGFRPASMKQVLRQQPPLAGDYLDARLYFLLPLFKFSLALLWITTGLLSAFGFPVESSYSMLNQVGIPEFLAPIFLYGAAGLDISLGVALLFSNHLRLVVILQITIMLTYTLFITTGIPEFWLHPFGPVSKNIPLIIASLLLLAGEK
jgi:uncharacterized protein YbjT (DUF2867 family)